MENGEELEEKIRLCVCARELRTTGSIAMWSAKVLRRSQPPTKLNRKIYAAPHWKYCVFRVFFPSLAWAKRTLNKFISQQKHHSAELSIPFPFSVSFQLDFSLCRPYLIPSPLLLRLSISNELGFIRFFCSFIEKHAFFCCVYFLEIENEEEQLPHVYSKRCIPDFYAAILPFAARPAHSLEVRRSKKCVHTWCYSHRRCRTSHEINKCVHHRCLCLFLYNSILWWKIQIRPLTRVKYLCALAEENGFCLLTVSLSYSPGSFRMAFCTTSTLIHMQKDFRCAMAINWVGT